MKKILIVTVKPNSAIDNLANMIRVYNPHLSITVLPVHPKRPDNLDDYEELAEQADMIDYHYWKTAEMLRAKFPTIRKPCLLAHHNPYDLRQRDWKDYGILTVPNTSMAEDLFEHTGRNIRVIPVAVDLNHFTFNDDYTKKKKVLMVSQRIESKKGVREVAQACYELGYEFILAGAISKNEYFKQVMKVNPDMKWMQWVSDDKLRELYQTSAVHVCNSVDFFESGTMPILEAMACGCPVLTRNVGIVPDINNGKNMVVRSGQPEDLEDLKGELKALMENRERRMEIRKEAWNTVKNLNAVRMAKMYAKLYNEVLFEEPLVSVIIPCYNRKEQVAEILKSLENQTYQNIEAVVADDNSDDGTEDMVKEIKNQVSFPVKYVNTRAEGYNLAQARNLGAIEAEGEVLVFCDSRLKPYSDAIYQFAKAVLRTREKVWCYGDKGAGRRSFVENFSAIRRSHLMNAGMFCERITRYGGQTQEIKTRFGNQGFEFRYVQFAKAKEILSSKAKNKRDDIWRSKQLLWQMYKNQ